MRIENLSESATRKLAEKLLKRLLKSAKEDDVQFSRDILIALVSGLDEADGDDTFGTEGWRHFFGVEDEF